MTAQRPGTSIDAISELFRTQRGLITRAQALRSGLSPSAIARRVGGGAWQSAGRGLYRSAAVPATWEQEVLGACLLGGEGTVASHSCAAALHELDDFKREGVEVWTPRRLRNRAIRCHTAAIPSTDMCVVAGIPATSIERTLLDLAGQLTEQRLELALDAALRQRKTSLARIRWRAKAAPPHGTKGIASLCRLIDDRSHARQTESPLELRLLRIVRRFGLPEPEIQYRVMEGARVVGRFDFAYPLAKLIVEVDGYRWHAGNHAWQRDRQRDNDLNRLGWTILRFTADDLRLPQQVARHISAVLSPSLDV